MSELFVREPTPYKLLNEHSKYYLHCLKKGVKLYGRHSNNPYTKQQIKIKINTMNTYYEELHHLLPYCRTILRVDTATPLDIVTLKALYGVDEYSDVTVPTALYRDKILESYGPIQGIPSINMGGRNGKQVKDIGVGLHLMRSRLGNVDYLVYHTATYDHYYNSFVIAKKGDLYKIRRSIAKSAKEAASQSMKRPILEEKLFSDIIKNSIEFIKRGRDLKEFNIEAKRGIILAGPPGNGKSMLCRYIKSLAIDANFSVGTITASKIERAMMDDDLENLFNRYQVSFFDDIDIHYFDRSKNGKAVCSMLAALDGLNQKPNNRVRIFTTNEATDSMDPAFLRPGRIDQIYQFKNPSAELRKRFIETWHPQILEQLNVDELIEQTHDCSFANINHVKTNLATRYIIDGVWDVEYAMSHLNDAQEEEQKVMGFGT